MVIRPTASEKTFHRFLKSIDWGFNLRIRTNVPFEVNGGRVLYPDFRLNPVRLIIEIDGSVHFRETVSERDSKRDFLFEERGYRVLHISNKDVLTMTEEVLAKRIQEVYQTFPNPTAEMDLFVKLFRDRDLVIKLHHEFKFEKKKKSRHDKHLLKQHLEYVSKYRPSEPSKNQGSHAISLKV